MVLLQNYVVANEIFFEWLENLFHYFYLLNRSGKINCYLKWTRNCVFARISSIWAFRTDHMILTLLTQAISANTHITQTCETSQRKYKHWSTETRSWDRRARRRMDIHYLWRGHATRWAQSAGFDSMCALLQMQIKRMPNKMGEVRGPSGCFLWIYWEILGEIFYLWTKLCTKVVSNN